MRSSLLWLSLVCVAGALPCYSAEPYSLVAQWQIDFGRGQEQATYRTAVCPDGTVYLSDNFGRVAVINDSGKVISRQLRREFVGANALACDASSRLYVATREIVVMRNNVMVSRAPTDVRISALAPAGDGTLYACGTSTGSRQPLHRIAADGTVLKSFGDDQPGAYRLDTDGLLLWQPDRKHVLFIPRWLSFEIQAYDPAGRYLGAYGPRSSFIRPVDIRPDPLLGDATGAGRLAGGEILVQRALTDWRQQPALLVYDSVLHRLGYVTTDMHRLIGAAGDSGVYFADVSPKNLQVFKMTLVRRSDL
jgi:hypothetical protein